MTPPLKENIRNNQRTDRIFPESWTDSPTQRRSDVLNSLDCFNKNDAWEYKYLSNKSHYIFY